MATLTARNPDEGFLISEANGFQSRDAVVLKSGSVYQPGSLVIAEYVASDSEAPTVFDEATGKYVLATAALLAAYQTVTVGLVCRYTNATAADTAAAAITGHAEVKDTELVLGSGVSASAAAAALAAQHIKVRAAL